MNRAGYQKILSKWGGLGVELCPDGGQQEQGPPSDHARVCEDQGQGPFNRAYGNVHGCAASFNSINDMQKISATVLHELSHRLDGTDDHAYCKTAPVQPQHREGARPTARHMRRRKEGGGGNEERECGEVGDPTNWERGEGEGPNWQDGAPHVGTAVDMREHRDDTASAVRSRMPSRNHHGRRLGDK